MQLKLDAHSQQQSRARFWHTSRTLWFSDGRASRLACFVAALLLIAFLFADVLFLRTSLAPIDYTDVLKDPDKTSPPASLLPERPYRNVGHGIGDIGSAAYQFEPSILFLAHCFRAGESPFWDPYTAAGTVGPETVDDVKFSPFSVIVALLGGSSRIFTFVLLVLYICSCYCFLRTCTEYLGLSFVAALAGCGAFFLSGFGLANLSTAIGQPYFWSPVLLLSCLLVMRTPSRLNVLLSLLAHVGFLAITFFPTAVLCAILVYSVVLAVCVINYGRKWYRPMLLVSGIAFLALTLLGFLYGAILGAHFTYLTDLSTYAARKTPGWNLVNLVSLFSPKHFWENQRAFFLPANVLAGKIDPEVQFIGIIASLIAVQAFATRRLLQDLLVIALGVVFLIAFGQAFGLPPFTLIDKLPFFSFVRNTYWMAMLTLAASLLTAIGADRLKNRQFSTTVFLAAAIAAAFWVAHRQVGFIDQPWTRWYVTIFWLLLVAGVSLIFAARYGAWAKPLLVALLFCEGIFYVNGLRPHRQSRDTHPPPSIAWVKSRVTGPGGDRVLNLGDTGVFPNWGAALGLPQLGDLNSIGAPRWYQEFYWNHVGIGLFLSIVSPQNTLRISDDSLTLAGVRYVIVDRTFIAAISRLQSFGYRVASADSVRFVFENPHPLARAFIVRSLLPGGVFPQTIRNSATTSDATLMRDAKALGVHASGAAEPQLPDRVHLSSYRHDFVQIRTTLSSPGVLVLTDTWTPWWNAYVDGRKIHVGIVDMAFRGIALRAGTHVVEYRYEPLALRIGEWITAFSAILLALILWHWNPSLTYALLASHKLIPSSR